MRILIFSVFLSFNFKVYAVGPNDSLKILYPKAPISPRPIIQRTPPSLVNELSPTNFLIRVSNETISEIKKRIAALTENDPARKLLKQDLSKYLGTYAHLNRHLKALKQSATTMGLNDMELRNMSYGIIYSDYGKGKLGVELLSPGPHTSNSELARSNRLLRVLSGQTEGMSARDIEAAKIINELAGGHLLPQKSLEEIRKGFKDFPARIGYLHELPGMIHALEALDKGLSLDEFKIRIQTNLFHNGPNEGFWKHVLEYFAKGNDDFFKGTVFENGYPSPNNRYSLWHTLLDRLDQGTGGGHLKFEAETKGIVPIQKFIHEMMNDNPDGTLEQFKILNQKADELLTHRPNEKRYFKKITDDATLRISNFKRQAKHKIQIIYRSIVNSVGVSLGKNPDGSIKDNITQVKIGRNIYSSIDIPEEKRHADFNYFRWESPEELQSGQRSVTDKLISDWKAQTHELNKNLEPMNFVKYGHRFADVAIRPLDSASAEENCNSRLGELSLINFNSQARKTSP
ncbi:MAG: hypothetical protein KA116_05635 [Proteobacteria bacterium]|nr:hypothetical protein [Pseudomonadota bacterium]